MPPSPPGTNINDAMLTAVRLLQSANQKELLSDGSVSLIILLTDGDPTVGEDTASNPRAHRPGGVTGVLAQLAWDLRWGWLSEAPLAVRFQKCH